MPGQVLAAASAYLQDVCVLHNALQVGKMYIRLGKNTPLCELRRQYVTNHREKPAAVVHAPAGD